jgi:heat shock transcription factor
MPMPAMQQQPYSTGQPDQIMRWNAAEGNAYTEAAGRGVNPYMMSSPAGQFGQGIQSPATTSTALARRGMSRALIPTAPRPSPFDSSPDSWNNFADEAFHHLQQQQQQQQQQQAPTGGVIDDNDSIEALEERALRAKKEAMNKRKQIPPFVQKLSR